MIFVYEERTLDFISISTSDEISTD